MKFEVTIKDEEGKPVAEFMVDEQAKDAVLTLMHHEVDEGDGHEVPKEDIE